MRLQMLAGLASALACAAQMVTVPEGTKFAIALGGPLSTRTAQRGDQVRAETTFPVAVGDIVVVPSGTYVEGAIETVRRRGRHAGFGLRFTRLIFANGYAVALSGSGSTELNAGVVSPGSPGAPPGMANGFQSFPQPPFPGVNQPSPPKSHMGLAIGLGVASAAALIVTAVLFGRHGEELSLSAGAPLELVLAHPLTIDTTRLPGVRAGPETR